MSYILSLFLMLDKMAEKRKKTVVTMDEKFWALKRLDTGELAKTIAAEMGVGTSTVSDWKKARSEIEKWCSSQTSTSGIKRMKMMKKATIEALHQRCPNKSAWIADLSSDPGTSQNTAVETPYVSSVIKTEPLDVIDDYDGQNHETEEEFTAVDPLFLDNPPDKSIAANRTETDGSSLKPETADDKNYIDEDKAFLLSLLPAMKELNGQQKMEFKMMILEQLRRLRYPCVESSNTVSNVTMLPVQDLTSVGPLTPVRPPPHIQEGVQRVIAMAGHTTTTRAPVTGKRSATKNRPADTSQETSSKTVQKPKSNFQPVRKRQKLLDPDTEPQQIDQLDAGTSKSTQKTITTTSITSVGETTPIVQKPSPIEQSTSRSSCVSPTNSTRITNCQTTTDHQAQGPSNNVDSTTETVIKTEIDVEEIKLEYIKVEPFVEYDGSDTET